VLLKSRRCLYVHAIVRTAEFPPRIHNLARLGELAGAQLSTEERQLLERLSLYYLQTRYPPELENLRKSVSRAMATEHLERTEALWRRLRRQLARRR